MPNKLFVLHAMTDQRPLAAVVCPTFMKTHCVDGVKTIATMTIIMMMKVIMITMIMMIIVIIIIVNVLPPCRRMVHWKWKARPRFSLQSNHQCVSPKGLSHNLQCNWRYITVTLRTQLSIQATSRII